MKTIETIYAKVQQLSAEDQQKVLDFIRNLPSAEGADRRSGANGTNREPAQPSIWAKLQALGQASEQSPCDLPTDLAANHDYYLHGLPRRS